MIILLILIYITFISIGLPDSIFGAAWPSIHTTLNINVAMGGLFTALAGVCSIITSINSGKLIKWLGTGKLTAISTLVTAIGLLAISFSNNLVLLFLSMIPLGVGGGAVDSALNDYVSKHFKARHMNWLHCFWGVGATIGPFMAGVFIGNGHGYRPAFVVIAAFQAVLAIIMFLTLTLWKRAEKEQKQEIKEQKAMSLRELLRLEYIIPIITAFFCYIAMEVICFSWGSTFLVQSKGLDPARAAKWISIFFLGITLGRVFSGLFSIKLNNNILILGGEMLCLVGIILLMLPIPKQFLLLGLLLIGVGCAPIFPSMLHETPRRFGEKMSVGVMGIQLALAYCGAALSPVFGFVASKTTFMLMPYVMLMFLVIIIFTNGYINHKIKKRTTPIV